MNCCLRRCCPYFSPFYSASIQSNVIVAGIKVCANFSKMHSTDQTDAMKLHGYFIIVIKVILRNQIQIWTSVQKVSKIS